MVSEHKTAESEGSKRVVFYTTADGSCVENEGEKTLITSTVDGGQLRKWTFQVADVNKARGSVSMMVRNGYRVVFLTSGSDIENKTTKEILWLREKDGVYVVEMMVAPPGREQKGTPSFGRRSMLQSLDVQMNQQKNMECGTEDELHATEETDTEEIRDEEQEEGAPEGACNDWP